MKWCCWKGSKYSLLCADMGERSMYLSSLSLYLPRIPLFYFFFLPVASIHFLSSKTRRGTSLSSLLLSPQKNASVHHGQASHIASQTGKLGREFSGHAHCVIAR